LAARTILEEVATISNPTPNYCGTIFLLELLLEVEFNENIKLLSTVCGFWKSEAKVGIEQNLGVLSELTTPPLPPHHQRRTAS
jgi:hypothetical protein